MATEFHYKSNNYPEFIEFLKENEIKYSQYRKLSETQAIAETIQVVFGSGGAVMFAKALVQWAKVRNSASYSYRKGDEEIKITDVSVKNLQKILEQHEVTMSDKE